MPIRNSRPLSWRPKGLTDSADGTNSFPGAMQTLANVIPDPSTAQVWVPRPAAERLTNFTGANAPAAAGYPSGYTIVGNIEYGLVPSSLNPGFDEPYAYDLANNAFLPVSGITSANVPASPPTSGDWTPPILTQVAERVIVTHPGFPGGLIKFGWFDISSASVKTTGDTLSGAPFIVGYPLTLGIQPGLAVSGATIAATTTVLSAFGPLTNATIILGTTVAGSPILTVLSNYGPLMALGAPVYCPAFPIGTTSAQSGNVAGPITLTENATVTGTFVAVFDVEHNSIGVPAFVGQTHSNTTLDSLTYGTSGMFAGMQITGTGIPLGTTIASITSGSALVLSQAATASGTITDINVIGTIITLSLGATGTANGSAITITGGTPSAPQWAAGDTDANPLPSKPVGVAQMNGRAWYALGTDGIVFSDSLLPCRVSNATGVQALTTNDGLPVTAIAPLMLSQPLTGGIVQSLVAFEGSAKMQQITGDQATANLQMNALQVATGTRAPLSIVPCGGNLGTAFVSPVGLRFVRLDGSVTPPVGVDGQGITQPFQYAISPSRICAAANAGVLRITAQNSLVQGDPFQEYWFDLDRQIWHGPHSFPARLIQPWSPADGISTFVVSPVGLPATLFQSDAYASSASSYTENGNPLSWNMETVLLPDNAEIAMNAMVEANLACAASDSDQLFVTALDENDLILDAVSIVTSATNQSLRQRLLAWTRPVIFKQMSIRVTGPSDDTVRIGNLYMRYEILGYNIDGDVDDNFLLADDGITILTDDAGTFLTPG